MVNIEKYNANFEQLKQIFDSIFQRMYKDTPYNHNFMLCVIPESENVVNIFSPLCIKKIAEKLGITQFISSSSVEFNIDTNYIKIGDKTREFFYYFDTNGILGINMNFNRNCLRSQLLDLLIRYLRPFVNELDNLSDNYLIGCGYYIKKEGLKIFSQFPYITVDTFRKNDPSNVGLNTLSDQIDLFLHTDSTDELLSYCNKILKLG